LAHSIPRYACPWRLLGCDFLWPDFARPRPQRGVASGRISLPCLPWQVRIEDSGHSQRIGSRLQICQTRQVYVVRQTGQIGTRAKPRLVHWPIVSRIVPSLERDTVAICEKTYKFDQVSAGPTRDSLQKPNTRIRVLNLSHESRNPIS